MRRGNTGRLWQTIRALAFLLPLLISTISADADPPTPTDNIGQVKCSADGSSVDIIYVIVSATLSDAFYVENSGRSSGIRVQTTSYTVSVGDAVEVVGQIQTNTNGERYVNPTSVVDWGSVTPLTPLGMSNKCLGGGNLQYDAVTGAGQQGVYGAYGWNNIGLLVKTCGKVIQDSYGAYLVDDGSLYDGGVDVGLKVVPALDSSFNGHSVIVTGISSCENVNGHLQRVLRVRSSNDLEDEQGAGETASLNIYSGFHYIALPNAPVEAGHIDLNVDPSGETWIANPYYIFGNVDYSGNVGGGLDPTALYKLDALGQSGQSFINNWNMVLGEGYGYEYSSAGQYAVTYAGLPDGLGTSVGGMADMAVSLPGNQFDAYTEPNPSDPTHSGGGQHLIGHPYAHNTAVAVSSPGDNVWFTDGIQFLDWQQAISAGWVDSSFQAPYAAPGGGTQTVTPDMAGGDLMSGQGYFLTTFKDNIALIVPKEADVQHVAPSITTQPVGQVISPGSTAVLTVVASGSPLLQYQWRRNGSVISGATSSSYTTGTAGSYACVVSNPYGLVTSNVATLAIATAPPSTIIRVDLSTGLDSNAGSSWTYPMATVQAALSAAGAVTANGGSAEIWVAAGIYRSTDVSPCQNFQMVDYGPPGGTHVALYGGFAGLRSPLYSGGETSRDQRNWAQNVTELQIPADDPNAGWEIAVEVTGALDGFTISGGCWGVSDAAGLVAHDIIQQSGISIMAGGDAVVKDNLLLPSDTGIIAFCAGGSPTILNNTIVCTDTNGVPIDGNGTGYSEFDAFSTIIGNNIITGFAVGIDSGFNPPNIFDNDVYGNTLNYSDDPVASQGNISVDPLFRDPANADYHLLFGSPCRNAGDVGVAMATDMDLDAYDRISMYNRVDIGAYECYNVYLKSTALPSDSTSSSQSMSLSAASSFTALDASTSFWPPVTVIYVDGSKTSDGNGTTWGTAWNDLQEALDAAAISATKDNLVEVWVAKGVYETNYDNSGFILPDYVALYGGFAGGESDFSERNWRTNITVLNRTSTGSVISAYPRALAVDGFTVQGGSQGINCSGGGFIAHNTIQENGIGLILQYLCSSGPEAAYAMDNMISGNGNIYPNYPSWCNGGVFVLSGAPEIVNNTIAYTSATGVKGPGEGIMAFNQAIIACNNIICGYDYGFWGYAGFLNNDVYGCNTSYSWQGADNRAPTLSVYHNLSANPLFSGDGDYHITLGSPCINAGWEPDVWDRYDIDGETRKINDSGTWRVDVGADEFYCVTPTTPVVTVDASSAPLLIASWTACQAPSGIAQYEYAVGTTSGGSDIADWATPVPAVAMNMSIVLAPGTYYVSVKAQSHSGVWSAVGTSSGVTVSFSEPPLPSSVPYCSQ